MYGNTPTDRFIKRLRKYKKYLTKQQYCTVRGQAVAGDITAAEKGLMKLLERSRTNG